MSWYYIEVTQEMKDNPEPYFKSMIRGIGNKDNVAATLKDMKDILSRTSLTQALALEKGYCVRWYRGAIRYHRSNKGYTEIKHIKKNIIGGELV